MFSNLDLCRRLERAEGYACAQFAESRRRLFPESRAEWIECAGAFVVFDGVGSPVTQSFGLGVFEELTAETLDVVEEFFFSRGSASHLEISPFAGVAALRLLCDRGYRPIEICSVLYEPLPGVTAQPGDFIEIRVVGSDSMEPWSDVSARAWGHEHPRLQGFLRESGSIIFMRKGGVCFLAEFEGTPGASASLCLHDGVALLAGAATVPELRRRGLQNALLDARLRYAAESGCDVAMMVAEVGSNSQRNAERRGFRVAYTRTKWELTC